MYYQKTNSSHHLSNQIADIHILTYSKHAFRLTKINIHINLDPKC